MSEKEITNELLARYLDGKTNEEENRRVLAYLAQNADEFEVMKIAAKAKAFNDLQKISELDSSQKAKKSVFAKSLFPKENLDDDIRYQLADHGKRKIAAATAGVAKSCAIQAQQIILQDYGIDVSQKELTNIARENGWYIDQVGSPMDYVGELLNYYNVASVQMRNANIYHLMHELSQGHKIIVGLDSNDLQQTEQWRQFDDVLSGKEANHVLVVAGIDTTNPNDVKVTLTDPTNDELQRVYPAKQFMDAWEESGYFMVATQKPAPLAYNPVSMQHFDYEQGYIEKFADIAYTEIVKRLQQGGFLPENRWSKIWRYFLFCFIIPLLVLGGSLLAWRYFTPIDMKIFVHEDASFQIPDMPFEKGSLTVAYSNISPTTYIVDNQNNFATINEINYKFKNHPAQIKFSANGFIPIDTTVNISEKIELFIRRDQSLGTIFGFVVDEKGKPVANALLTTQNLSTYSDENGKFSISIPFEKQKIEQSLTVQKEGFQTWIHHSGKPSQTEAWCVVLKRE